MGITGIEDMWLQMLAYVAQVVIAGAVLWFIRDYWKFKAKVLVDLSDQRRSHDLQMAEIQATIASITTRCAERISWLESLTRTTKVTSRNVVRMAAKLGVEELESPD